MITNDWVERIDEVTTKNREISCVRGEGEDGNVLYARLLMDLLM
jgi:hypothetical protein